MELQKPLIKFYQKRSFGEKMTASLDFVRDNFKLLFKLCVYLILPVSLIQAIFLNGYLGGIASGTMLGDTYGIIGAMIWNLLGMLVVGIIGTSLVTAIAFTCIQVYNQNGTLKGLTFNDLKNPIIANTKRVLFLTLVVVGISIGFYLIVIASIFISPFLLIITLPAFFAIILPLLMAYPIYIFERLSIGQTLSRSFKLGFKTWGGLFGILFVMSFLVGLIQGVASVPWYIVFMVKIFFIASNTAIDVVSSFGYSILQYLTNVIMMFFALATSIFIYLGLAYHYSSAAESSDAISVNEDLENFEEL